jgi:hypothetical protein
VFLYPFALLIPIGLFRAATSRWSALSLVLLIGFFTAPLGPTVVKEMMINRMLVLLPFTVLLATYAVEYFLTGGALRRAIGIGLLAAMPLQFAGFYRDYMGDYRLRTAVWFERNIRGMTEEIIAMDGTDRVPAVYLATRDIPWGRYQWPFYLLKYNRTDLMDRTVFFDPDTFDPAKVPAGAVVVTFAESALLPRLRASGLFDERRVIAEPTGEPSFIVFMRRIHS